MDNYPVLNGKPASIHDIKNRKEHVKRIVIEHPKYKAIYKRIEETHLFSLGSSQADGVFLTGISGVGKTTLLKDYTERFPRKVVDGTSIVPILYFKVPVGATPKAVASQILYELGDINFDKGTQVQLTTRIFYFVERCKVEMIIMDEFQHLIDRDTEHVLNKASDWIKTFLEEVNIPVLLCGMPEAEKIFIRNKQLDRRFCIRESLEPFNYRTRDEQNEFRTFLKVIDNELPFQKPANLANPKLAEKIFYATKGVPFFVLKILEEATVEAAKNGMDLITEFELYEAYRKITLSQRPNSVNPFNNNEFNLIDAFDYENRKNKKSKS